MHYGNAAKDRQQGNAYGTGLAGHHATGKQAVRGRSALLDQVRRAVRIRGYAYRTEKTYVHWTCRYVFFHGKRHPAEMGAPEIMAFLSYLATDRHVSASTQNQALNALVFLYKRVLEKDVDSLRGIVRAKRPKTLPVVLSVAEVEQILSRVQGTKRLMLTLLYGTGMRLNELLSLRVKDIDFEDGFIFVRRGKGKKDRTVPLPASTMEPLKEHLAKVKNLHRKDLADGYGAVNLPYALDRKYPEANRELGWQYVFPSGKFSIDPRSGRKQRYHVYENFLQKTIKRATREAGIVKPVHAHTFRHSFATHLLDSGTDIRTVQELLGHKDVRTTMVYTHVLKRGPLAVISPAERLQIGEPQPQQPAARRRTGFWQLLRKCAALLLLPVISR